MVNGVSQAPSIGVYLPQSESAKLHNCVTTFANRNIRSSIDLGEMTIMASELGKCGKANWLSSLIWSSPPL